jgi:hypothetical protein
MINVDKGMAGLFKKVFGKGGDKRAAKQARQGGGDTASADALEVARLTEIVRFFPVGDRVSYYPEYQKDGALETIVLGYGVNDHFIYSPIDIRSRRDGERDVLQLGVNGQEKLVHEVDKFCFMIPFNREDETKRDYARRAELGTHGAFRRNNTVTLVAFSTSGSLSSIDTTVRRVVSLDGGIYAGHEIVLLDVVPSSLKLTDQRQHFRLPTSLLAELTVQDCETYFCALMDFSNDSVQLQFENAVPDLAALTESRRLTLDFSINHDRGTKDYRLDGVMYRKTNTSLVMKLQGIYKGGKRIPLGLMDILDIKSNLLRHPETYQGLKEADKKKGTAGQ